MGKRTTKSKPKTERRKKKRSLASRSRPSPARRAKKVSLHGKIASKPAKPVARKPKASPVRKRLRPAKPAVARRKRAASKKPVRRRTAKTREKRARMTEKLLALKAAKLEKPEPRKEGFLIKAPKKAKRENLVAPLRFTRRPPPSPAGTPAVSEPVTPPKSVLRKKDLEALRRALDQERQRLIAQLAALDETASLTGPSEVNENVPGYSIHLAEYASDNQVVETTLAQRVLQAERLAEIEEALQRINNPGYGICQNCGKPISLERLKVKPSAPFCVPCRQLKEQGRL